MKLALSPEQQSFLYVHTNYMAWLWRRLSSLRAMPYNTHHHDAMVGMMGGEESRATVRRAPGPVDDRQLGRRQGGVHELSFFHPCGTAGNSYFQGIAVFLFWRPVLSLFRFHEIFFRY